MTRISNISLLALGMVCLYIPPLYAADPFESCPTQAFLIQSPRAVPIAFGVDLATGSYTTLSPDMGTTKVNGVGFNYHDNYMYGWDYGSATLSQIGNDYQVNPLTVTNLIGKSFYVGDVSVSENAWYGYRSRFGLYRIDLTDPSSTLVMESVASSGFMGNPSITDMAFHPTNSYIYTVDNNGYLIKINPANGDTTILNQVLNESELGFNFVFGAQYFDANGNLYLSNNGNGYIYRVTINDVLSTAIFYAYGPSSNSNDGARCALAEIEVGDSIDFGDAPDSYGSSLDNAGARHSITSLYLGTEIDAEADAYIFPLSDDISDGNDDDDGISFPTGIEIGETALIVVNVTGTGGYLNAWLDMDMDGTFEDGEQIVQGLSVSPGATNLSIDIPMWALAGDTWARFRISSSPNIGATGGVSDGEVEDYLLTIIESGVTSTSYPDGSNFTSFAFEDLYPALGDFDMNDVLMNVRITEYVKYGMVIRLKIEGELAAMGANYRNGFAIQLPGIDLSSIKSDSVTLTMDSVLSSEQVLEDDQTNAVLIISDNLWDIIQPGENGCHFFRTEDGCGTSQRPTWTLIVPFIYPVAEEDMPDMPYDPFIFARPGTYHGDVLGQVAGEHPGRKFEVHLKNKNPTDTFEELIFGQADDASNASLEVLFQTLNGIPWALEIPMNWKHPKEGISLLQAYPQFFGHASDSTGQTNSQWYLESNADSSSIFND